MRNIFQKLHTTYRVQAAKLLLYRLRDKGWLDMRTKEDRVYRDAEIKFMIENPYYLEIFMMTGDEDWVRFRDHKRDKNGKLVSVEYYAIHGK